jgi:hypothetical protein
MCRVLLNIQQFRHGGGLLVTPAHPAGGLNVKYTIHYDRLPRALIAYARHQLGKRQTAQVVAEHCRRADDVLACDVHFDAVTYQRKLEEHRREVLGVRAVHCGTLARRRIRAAGQQPGGPWFRRRNTIAMRPEPVRSWSAFSVTDTRNNESALMRGHALAKLAFISYGGTPDGSGRTYEPAVPRRRAVFLKSKNGALAKG